ncbi:MAG TPA: hypothetical protein VG755_21315 [Nannocystaceae bacterium]|nr:hypothetical protein [Nannocystaceae bacterium]
MRRFALVIALVACEPAPEPEETSATGFTGGSSDGWEPDPCPEVDPCEYCPAEITELCGMPCDNAGKHCNDESGAGMTCTGGVWRCDDAPPLQDECARVCAPADGCDARGCSSGVDLRLHPSGGNPIAGAYQLELVVDGTASSCTFVISDGPGCETSPCVTDTTCNASYLLDGEPSRIELELPIATTLALTVLRDGGVILEDEPELFYDLDDANGSGCTPVCGTATVRLDIP